MDTNQLILLRFLERITVVLVGGLAIYLGFRLFLAVPEHRDSSGKLVLPWDISIVMTKVGPGVFFALFGAVTVGLALIQPLEINSQGARRSDDDGRHSSVRYVGSALGDRNARADARALLRREIAYLNTIPEQLRADLPQHERNSIKRALARVKLSLMKPVWGEPEEGFGDVSQFEEWVQADEPDPPPTKMDGALTLYRQGTKEPHP
jgi:hypothetical protein